MPPGEEGADAHRAPTRWRALERIADLGASAQAALPGLYAWGVTVAPAAWSRGAPLLARGAALVGAAALVSAPLLERSRRARWARAVSVWGLALTSVVVWLSVPAAVSAARLDGVRGGLGMLGWALFAFASAGPALRRDPELAERITPSAALAPRGDVPRGDAIYVAGGVVIAAAMQLVGWRVAAPERAVLVRLVTIACAIAVLGGATNLALARHTRRAPASRSRRLRRALPWMLVLAFAAASGVALALSR